MLDLGARLRNSILLYVGLIMLGFGLFNVSTAYFAVAQEDASNKTSLSSANNATNTTSTLSDTIIQRLLTEIGPIVAGIVTIGIQFARKQGLKISAEAEEYFVNATKSFVDNQTRFLYKEIRDNPQYREHLIKGRIPPELGEKAKQNVISQLKVELQSDEFTKVAREMLTSNLDTLVERYVTENKKEMSERIRVLLNELVPVVVDATLLYYNTPQDAQDNKDKIIAESLESIGKVLETEELLFSHDNAKLFIKSELNKRIGNVK